MSIVSITQKYNHNKYWKWRAIVVDKNNNTPKLLKLYYLYRIKRMDAFNNSSFGTHLDYGPTFEEPPTLPHGIRGIFVCHQASVGKNCVIFHQVTLGVDPKKDKGPNIGDNVLLGAGCKILGDVNIGDNVTVGANCVVLKDVPSDTTVLPQEPIFRKHNK